MKEGNRMKLNYNVELPTTPRNSKEDWEFAFNDFISSPHRLAEVDISEYKNIDSAHSSLYSKLLKLKMPIKIKRRNNRIFLEKLNIINSKL